MKKVKNFMKKDLPVVKEGTSLTEIINIFSNSSHNICPVVDEKGKLIGLVSLEELLEDLLLSKDEVSFLEKISFLADFFTETIESVSSVSPLVVAKDIMQKDVFVIKENDSMVKAAILMKKKGVHRLIVVDEENRPVGYISRNEICKAFLS